MIWELVSLLVVLIAIILIFLVIRNIILLAINSAIGFFALFGFNYLFNAGIAINFWSILITAIGGVAGFVIILVAHYFKLAF